MVAAIELDGLFGCWRGLCRCRRRLGPVLCVFLFVKLRVRLGEALGGHGDVEGELGGDREKKAGSCVESGHEEGFGFGRDIPF